MSATDDRNDGRTEAIPMNISSALTALLAGTAVVTAAAMPDGVTIADRVMHLTRDSRWTLASTIDVRFPTFHPQGMVRIGDRYVVSSVEVRRSPERGPQPDGHDRTTGEGVGHLFTIGADGALISDTRIGNGSIYHPGGIDFDGTTIWVPVAEYRPDSRSIIYAVDPATMAAREVLRVADHIGGIVHDPERHTLHGVSWGSRRYYRWTLDDAGRVTNADAPLETIRTLNPSHYVDYQDCKFAGRARMLCTGVAELRPSPGAPPFRLGGLDLVSLQDGRPLHQVPVPLWTTGGLDMTHNPAWLEATPSGLRGYFMPEDRTSRIYVYDVRTETP